MPDFNISVASPALFLGIFACVLFIADLFVPKDRKDATAWAAIIGLVIAAVLTVQDFNRSAIGFEGMFVSDSFTGLINLTSIITAFISIVLAYDYLKRADMERGEYYPVLLLTTVGAMFMGGAGDLIIVFVALELLSIPLYILAGFRRHNLKSEEGAMKYFLLGAFATGFLVYGIALVYGAAGTTNFAGIFERVAANELQSTAILLVGAGLILVGLGFKVGAVPFHMWTPDVYEGSPTSVTAFMSVAAKVGGFAALLRIMTFALPVFAVTGVAVEPGQTLTLNTGWQDAVAVVAGVTMLLGNVVALQQKDLKRLLAYSSIAHAGYIMMAVAAAGTFTVTADAAGIRSYGVTLSQEAAQGALIYLLAYAFTNLGAFGIILAVEKADGTGTMLDNLSGLGRIKPFLALAMSVFMLSLTGIPLTGGFMGKWFVFRSAINANLILLAGIGVITSVVSAVYYLRVIVKMWFEDGEATAAAPRPFVSIIALCVAGTIILGTLPLAINFASTITTVASAR